MRAKQTTRFLLAVSVTNKTQIGSIKILHDSISFYSTLLVFHYTLLAPSGQVKSSVFAFMCVS